MRDRQSSPYGRLSRNRWPLQQASSTLVALTDGELSLEGGSLFLNRPLAMTLALSLFPSVEFCRVHPLVFLANYYMSQYSGYWTGQSDPQPPAVARGETRFMPFPGGMDSLLPSHTRPCKMEQWCHNTPQTDMLVECLRLSI
jgi:hypothetical protein